MGGLISADQEFFCEKGEYKIGKNLIRDSSPQGVLTFEQVLKKSPKYMCGKNWHEHTAFAVL
ncbi:MAG: hypothetical protein CM1200mP28_15760 [Deltaproteobacteria bacterium]|nr:MAG: hypothetical protein CM1200mP28_15760 [Deltaproteobacteria bacterium]